MAAVAIEVAAASHTCPTCGQAIILPAETPPVVRVEAPSILPMAEVQRHLATATERLRFNPKDADALQALWAWQEVVRLQSWRRRRSA